MKQLIQNFKTGELNVENVPMPVISEGMVLVENKFSLISSGTEKGTVKVAKANIIGKAKQRPDLVAQVLQNIRKEGLSATLQKVKTKLDSPKALGYSTSGVVLATMDSGNQYKPGDRVACAGQDYASHAEIVAVPQNLVARIPENVSFEEASFTTLGAIALQGVRQANPKLGDNILVIGLGLLGQITAQLLKANGCNVFGVDLSDNLVQLAGKLSVDVAVRRGDHSLPSIAGKFTNGYGFDAVVITAATKSNDPIELGAELSRKKGKIIIVGAVGMDIPRDPHFYRKELDLRMSCSYGPGRYDPAYEENSIDYPFGYVRWTEQRNMEAFLNLVSKGMVNVKPLVSHVFDISESEKAYDLVLGKVTEPHLAILLRYADNQEKFATSVPQKSHKKPAANLGFIGAGSFAQNYLIPYASKWGASMHTVVTSQGITSLHAAKKFGFSHSSTNPDDLLNNEEIDTVFIATRHNTHAEFTKAALLKNKNVFVEKPLAMNREELEEIAEIVRKSPVNLMVGYNRRFAPVSGKIKQFIQPLDQPLAMNFRVNAGFIPNEHWIQNEKIGGGRIIGEMCHFIDLMQYFCDSLPQKIFAQAISSSNKNQKNSDNINISISFADGSIGNLTYVANGDKALPKERLEIFCGGIVGIVHDFRYGEIYSGNKRQILKYDGKGHHQEVTCFLEALDKNQTMPIAFESLYYTSLATFKILDSLYSGLPQWVYNPGLTE